MGDCREDAGFGYRRYRPTLSSGSSLTTDLVRFHTVSRRCSDGTEAPTPEPTVTWDEDSLIEWPGYHQL